ncbi:MAG: MBL fold metallo-hydrolase [Chloroflexi bacterium]|nr:MBL fold metallo-hydrolase [Chloroflexota bacterium]MBM3175711.1 MBL fold metallo-hydrolase [Chloroflexota bacterium]MBM4451357.1 MBL fold metallo-hydrolase [Chloroflexota bacterium]MBM4453262.1 MBL fold metallo-hydrolase [Chloroflexota bacterium]
MKLKWLGHACFLITSDGGLRIITDPYAVGGGVGYSPIRETADIVTVSHGHADHNNAATIAGNPEVVTDVGVRKLKGIEVKGVDTHHDESAGKARGNNVVFCFSVDGVKICHLGDLGHRLSSQQVAEIGAVDVLLIPVGGFFTIDAVVASQVCDDLKPRVVVPMHYKTSKLEYPVAGVDDFLKGKKNVKNIDSSEVELKAGQLPGATEIMVLKHAM